LATAQLVGYRQLLLAAFFPQQPQAMRALCLGQRADVERDRMHGSPPDFHNIELLGCCLAAWMAVM
jgi:hypothetical protein